MGSADLHGCIERNPFVRFRRCIGEQQRHIREQRAAPFWVNCSNDVATAPALYSATPRTLVWGTNSLAFSLSTSAPGGTELSTAPPGTSLGIGRDGTNQTVTLYGRILASDFRSLRAGAYARSIALTIEY